MKAFFERSVRATDKAAASAKEAAEGAEDSSKKAAEEVQAAASSAAESAKGVMAEAAEGAKDLSKQAVEEAKKASEGSAPTATTRDVQSKVEGLESRCAAATSAGTGAAHSLMASAREALQSAEGNVKDAAAKEAIDSFAPAPFGTFAGCFGVPCTMATLDKAEFVVPETNRPQMRAAIDAYKSF
uniref:Uncharacterized protein n=1 Tax=Alexandrium catenella TaxID=2925 RepID=A0A7S1WSB5_ALECA